MLRGAIRSWLDDESGAIGPTYAVAILVLVAIAGVGFDYGRLAALDTELQHAADHAALAGATQLDGETGACSRAVGAVQNYIRNNSRIANDGGTPRITFVSAAATPTDCSSIVDGTTGSFIKFWQDKNKVTPADPGDESTARFIEVAVDARSVRYALTPLVGLASSDRQHAAAMAGIGSSICKVPPLMICSPDPANPFNAEGKRGWGLKATGHSGGSNSWAPGDFGFLEVGTGAKADLERALAYKELPFDCVPIGGTRPETGSAQGLFRAINTRFDIYDDSGPPLNECISGENCPAASNVVKDLIRDDSVTTGNNDCKTHNSGWKLTNAPFVSRTGNQATDTNASIFHSSTEPAIAAMGLTRDLCHYESYVEDSTGTDVPGNLCNALTGLGSDDPDNKFGNGRWARRDYFNRNHPSATWPPAIDAEYLMNSGDPTSFTRYGLYKWELAQNNFPRDGTVNGQWGNPLCSTGTNDGIDRRVLTLAIVKNCADLSGASTAVVVDEWIDAFLVEPSVDRPNDGAGDKDLIYFEIIGPARLGGNEGGVLTQNIRRDVPYLVR